MSSRRPHKNMFFLNIPFQIVLKRFVVENTNLLYHGPWTPIPDPRLRVGLWLSDPCVPFIQPGKLAQLSLRYFIYEPKPEFFGTQNLAHSEAPPSASGAHYRHGLIGPEFWNHYIPGLKTYKTHSILAHIYHKSLAELWFSFAERDIPHKSVFNTWKLSKKWPLG